MGPSTVTGGWRRTGSGGRCGADRVSRQSPGLAAVTEPNRSYTTPASDFVNAFTRAYVRRRPLQYHTVPLPVRGASCLARHGAERASSGSEMSVEPEGLNAVGTSTDQRSAASADTEPRSVP